MSAEMLNEASQSNEAGMDTLSAAEQIVLLEKIQSLITYVRELSKEIKDCRGPPIESKNGFLGKRVKASFFQTDKPDNAYVTRLRGKLGTIVSHPIPDESTTRFIVVVLFDTGEMETLWIGDLELVGEGA